MVNYNAASGVVRVLPFFWGNAFKGQVLTIRLLVADDHEVVRSGIGTLLEGSDVEIVGLAGTVEETVSLTRQVTPDVILLDVRMGEEDGLIALEQIRCEQPEMPVIMISTYDNPTYVARAIALGAHDYILEDSSRIEVLEAVRRAAGKEHPSDSSILRRIQATMASVRSHRFEGCSPDQS